MTISQIMHVRCGFEKHRSKRVLLGGATTSIYGAAVLVLQGFADFLTGVEDLWHMRGPSWFQPVSGGRSESGNIMLVAIQAPTIGFSGLWLKFRAQT